MFKYIFLIFCLLGAAWQLLNTRAARLKAANAASAMAEAKAAVSANKPGASPGFVFMPAPKTAAPGLVLVIVPPDAPKEAALRAETLLAELRAVGIPGTSAGQAAFSVPTQAEAGSVNAFMSGPLPLVFIGDMACANPAPAEVIAEYRRTHPK